MSFRTVRPLISSFSASWAPDHSRRDSSRVRRRSRRADVLSTLSDLASYCGTDLAAIADSLGSLFVGHFEEVINDPGFVQDVRDPGHAGGGAGAPAGGARPDRGRGRDATDRVGAARTP